MDYLEVLPLNLLQITSSFLLVIAVGYSLKRTKILSENDSGIINNIVIYFTLPALVFSAVVNAKLSVYLLNMSLLAILVSALLFTLTYLIGRSLKFEPTLFGGWMIAASIGNTAFLGYSIVVAAFGTSGLIGAVFFDYAIGIIIYTVGIYISKVFGKNSEEGFSILEFLKFPALLAIVPALIFHYVKLPAFLLEIVEQIGKSTAPLVLLSISINIKKFEFKGEYLALASLLLVKLIISPIIAVLLGYLLNLDKQLMAVGLVQSAMPPAMMAVVFGIKYGLKVDFLVKAVLIGTFLSMFTIPAMAYLLLR